MIVAAFQDYLPLGDIWKILAACLLVAVVAPLAVSLAIVGEVRQRRLLLVLGVAIVAGLLAAGLYTLFAG